MSIPRSTPAAFFAHDRIEGLGDTAEPSSFVRETDVSAPAQTDEDDLCCEQSVLKRVWEEHEEFRAALAHEIHEEFAQQLIGAMLYFQGAQRLRGEDAAMADECLAQGITLLQDSINQTRRLVNQLRPSSLDDFGLVAAVNCLVWEMSQTQRGAIDMLVSGAFENIPTQLQNAAFRIVQKLLKNACAHSGSETICVKLAHEGDTLHIEVQDWGVGFDRNAVGQDGYGLKRVAERARLLGGHVVIETAPGAGTRVTVGLPLR